MKIPNSSIQLLDKLWIRYTMIFLILIKMGILKWYTFFHICICFHPQDLLLNCRYEKGLPAVDIFVCTADPVIEPPIMVVNTVLSVMAYDYPQEKLGVYLSDDAGSELTFYALLEASHFSKHWIPYCKKFKIEPRSPAVYFSLTSHLHDADQAKELEFIQVWLSCWRVFLSTF